MLLLSLLACVEVDPCPEGSMLEGEEGLVVTEDEHPPEGWGQPECFACHAAPVLHRTGCTPDVDLEAVRARVEEEGTDACADCHGEMGVSR
jgi:hypothetical protein